MARSVRSRQLAVAAAVVALSSLLGGCASTQQALRGPIRLLVQSNADALVALDSAAARQARVAALLAEARAAAAAAYREAADARAQLVATPEGAEALSDACGVLVDAATGQVPVGAEERVRYLFEVARVRSPAQSLLDDVAAVEEVIMAYRDGRADAAALQLATLGFTSVYC